MLMFLIIGTFREVFNPVVEGYHKGFKVAEHKHVTDLDHRKIKIALSASAQKKIISTRIRVARNLGFFPLNPGGTKQTRLDIAALMGKVFSNPHYFSPKLTDIDLCAF